EIVRAARPIRSRQAAQGSRCKRVEIRNRDLSAGGIHDPGQRIDNRYRQYAVPVIQVGKCSEVQILLKLPEPFIVNKEECAIFDEGAADGCAELISLKRRFRGRRELKTFGIEGGVA